MRGRTNIAAIPPLVSIITPCLNADGFIEDTIRSVLHQDYPSIEYLVMDGGSTDHTLAILQSFEGRLRFVSEPDNGAADAINKGISLSRGRIVAWLNADDLYLPNAISTAVDALTAQAAVGSVYGEGFWIDAGGKVLGRYPTSPNCDFAALGRECCVCQPTCFMRREALEAVGFLDAALKASFDYDLWIRLAKRYALAYMPFPVANSRMHTGNKTLSQREVVFDESMNLLERHYGYVPPSWIYGRLCYERDGRDQFYEPLHHSISAYMRALPVGLRRNRQRRLRYIADWIMPHHLGRLLGLKPKV